MRNLITGFFGLMCFPLLAACNLTDSSGLELAANASPQAPGAHRPLTGLYVLGPNDHVHVNVYGEAEITNDYEVDGSGFVTIPLAGRVRAAGLSTAQLAHSIMGRLKDGIIHDPKVTVTVAGYAPYYIQGEVKQGGEFVYKSGLTVQDAVAAAGGFTYRADMDRVFLRRAGQPGEVLVPLDAPIPVYPGDNIRIPERYF
jgi:polysaccharide export outer membrane protein